MAAPDGEIETPERDRTAASVAPVLLAAMVGFYVAIFGFLTWRQHANYGTFGFDMGLHDQGIWLTSRFREPFVTVRGMNYYGHHVNLVSVLYAPLYWLGAGPPVLALSQAVSLALGAVPLFLLVRHRTGSPTLALVPAAAWLLHPSVEWMTWWHWHPEVMAVTPLLYAWWFAVSGKWRLAASAAVFALLCKEDVALAVTMAGIAGFWWIRRSRGDEPLGWKRATGVFIAGLGWFALCTRLVIPAILGDSPFYERNLFPEFGDSLGSVLVGIVTQPGKVISMLLGPERVAYFTKLLVPFGLLAPFAAPVLLIAGPQAGVNALSALPGTYDIRFQYSAMVMVGVALASAEGFGRIVRWWQRRTAASPRWARRVGPALLAVWLAGAALASNVAWSPSPLGKHLHDGTWARRTFRHDTFDRAVALVPADADVSATYYLIPHLTHRSGAYEWPNPWKLVNWGLSGEAAPDPDSVDFVVLDTNLGQESELLADLLSSGEYDVLLDDDGVLVLRRVNIPDR